MRVCDHCKDATVEAFPVEPVVSGADGNRAYSPTLDLCSKCYRRFRAGVTKLVANDYRGVAELMLGEGGPK